MKDNKQKTIQRLINGEPAPYDSPLIVIEDQSKIETYEARCVIHHIVLEKHIHLFFIKDFA